MKSIAVAVTHDSLLEKGKALAYALNLPLTSVKDTAYLFLLIQTESHLELRAISQPKLKPLLVNFSSGKLLHRQHYGGGRGQLIARAVGIKSKITLKVLDLTAGLGEDAFVLASLGCDVVMVERNPIIAALLHDGLLRLKKHPDLGTLKLSMIQSESLSYLQTLNEETRPDVIYLDPMFPYSNKTALAKKEMRLLREIVGSDQDAAELLTASRKIAKKRVVVKRPRLAPNLSQDKPDIIFLGKSGRFDVYTQLS